MADLGYKVDDVEKAAQDGYILSPGWYPAVIVESEVKQTSTGGRMVVFDYEIQDGTKRTVRDYLNINNKNEIAQKIARADLAKLALAVGHRGELINTDILHGRPFKLQVENQTYTKGDGTEGKKNARVAFQAIGAPTPAPVGAIQSEGDNVKPPTTGGW